MECSISMIIKWVLAEMGIIFMLILFLPKTEVKALTSEDYFYEESKHYPYHQEYGTSSNSRYKWQNGHIYIQIEYGTWRTGWNAGYDHFWLKDINGNIVKQWTESRSEAKTTGELYQADGHNVYRRDSGWIDIGGAKPSIPVCYFSSSGENYGYYFESTANGIARFSYDYSWTSGNKYEYIEGDGLTSEAEDPIVAFYYWIDQSPYTMVSKWDMKTTTGHVDVSSVILEEETNYIHIRACSYTGILSDQADIRIDNTRAKRKVELSGGTGISQLIGAGTYYPGEVVTISAEVMEKYEFVGWSGECETAEQTYSFIMPLHHVYFQAEAARIEHAPTIQAKDLYYTLEEARSGAITEYAIGTQAYAWDEEDGEIPYGIHANQTKMILTDYQPQDFTSLTKSGSVTETYQVFDHAGNTCSARITVYVVDTSPVSGSALLGRTRFISGDYWKDGSGNYISESAGGFSSDSCWVQLPEYANLLNQLFGHSLSGG